MVTHDLERPENPNLCLRHPDESPTTARYSVTRKASIAASFRSCPSTRDSAPMPPFFRLRRAYTRAKPPSFTVRHMTYAVIRDIPASWERKLWEVGRAED